MASHPSFTWRPGEGPRPAAIARMRAHFARPSAPMGEAWFMGFDGRTRRMHDELLGELPSRVPARALASALWDIATGTTCFGHLDEWTAWFDHLLPDLVLRAGEKSLGSTLLECTMTSFFALYWEGIPEKYEGFRIDVLDTLGVSLMGDAFFGDGDLVDSVGSSSRWPSGPPWFEVPGEVSASLFFSLKYLSLDELPGWIDSLLAIEGSRFRSSLIVWMLGARDILRRPTPRLLPLSRARPPIEWENSHVLESAAVLGEERDGFAHPFLPPETCKRYLSQVLGHLDTRYFDWLEVIWKEAVVAPKLRDLPDQFFDEYLARRKT